MNLTIDNRKINLDKPVTVLDAAKQHGIDIPSLCAHPELTPYGGCRLCVVEIEGRKGYPTSCTTMAEEGMIVRTDTHMLQEMRRDVIQLILSEHPAACLMCGDIEGCELFQQTIRKVGITTGCRWCPKDKDCELQRIVSAFGIEELTLPGLYRDIPLEKYDPFFDRDYNLCIYCGRCVRICEEHRKSAVLSLRQRGKLTTIGPAFDTTHIDAGCEFCGACVSVCPTGAMSEKSRKWWGVPEKYTRSVCPLCSLNCEVQALTLKDKMVGTLPIGNPHEAGGELCVKGRFCLSEMVNRTERTLEPQYRYPEGIGIVNWDFALERSREIIGETSPGRSAVLISPGLSLEEICAARFLGENLLQTKELSSSCMDADFINYIHLARQSVSLKEVKRADALISCFLDGNYNFAPLTIAVKAAAERGIPYYQLGWVGDTTSRFARHRFFPVPEKMDGHLDQLITSLKKGSCDLPEIRELSGTLKKAKRSVFIIGPQILSLSNCTTMLEKIAEVVVLTGSRLFIPDPYGNLSGLISLVNLKPIDEISRKLKEGKIDLLYLFGDNPFTARPNVKRLIYQSAFPPPEGLNPEVILPAALWGETGGSFMNTDGTVRQTKPVATPHGYARSHFEIVQQLAGATEKAGVIYSSGKMKQLLRDPVRLPKKPGKYAAKAPDNSSFRSLKHPFVLVQAKNPHPYCTSNLGRDISAFGELVHPGKVHLNPRDAIKLGIQHADPVHLKSGKSKLNTFAVIRKNIPRGHIYLSLMDGTLEFENNPCYVAIRKDHV